MPKRRGEPGPGDPRRRSGGTDDGYDAPDYYVPGVDSTIRRRPMYGARGTGRHQVPESDAELDAGLARSSVPRAPRSGYGDERRASSARLPAFPEKVSLREPSILVPGKDSGKFATARRTARVPALRDTSRAPASGYQAHRGRDDWEVAEAWEASQTWEALEDTPAQRSLAPALAAHQRQPASRRRVGAATQALARRARSRWWTARYLLAVIAALAALGTTFTAAGQPAEAHQTFQASASSKRLEIVAQQVRPITSLLHPEQYDSKAQFDLYGGAACSPTVLAEVLTAWGVPNATIGHMIDDLGPDLSPYGGLLDQQGFEVVAAKHNMRADISWHLTYDQILYLTNVLGIPVIVNFRRDYGYYHYFAGGHFLAVTGGDKNGVNIVDSSEYFIKYLPHDVFDGLWQWRGDGTAMTVVIVPSTFEYSLPK